VAETPDWSSEPDWAPQAAWTDLDLDLHVAIADARQRVYAAHGKLDTAAAWGDVVVALADVRAERSRLYDEMDGASNPVKTVDLGEIPDDD
jgi:outer membrane protein TolC